MSIFSVVEPAPPVEIYALNKTFGEDTDPNKIDLGIGAYRTNEAKPWVLPVVRKAEKQIVEDESLNHEYLGQLGHEQFSKAATLMLLGEDSVAIKENRAYGIQCVNGTSSIRIGADFLVHSCGLKIAYVSQPTWANHNLLLQHAGFTEIRNYRYWDKANKKLDFDGLIEDLKGAPPNSVVIFHPCAHNPTGIDPTEQQWETIANVVKENKLFPFFDCAYQGFASGDLVKDSFAVRYFVSKGLELFVAQSFSKNFGLYNENVGNLTIVLNDPTNIVNMKAQITLLVRGNYSNPPAHGARIVSAVLNDKQLYNEWQECIKTMSKRINDMRVALRNKLEELQTEGNWDHITTQIGMFSFTGLTQQQVQYLIQKYHIYLLEDGRINICGLNTNNVDYVAKAINDAVKKFPENKSNV